MLRLRMRNGPAKTLRATVSDCRWLVRLNGVAHVGCLVRDSSYRAYDFLNEQPLRVPAVVAARENGWKSAVPIHYIAPAFHIPLY